jgi:hypothetical protein
MPDIKINVGLIFYGPELTQSIASCNHQIIIDLASPAFIKENFSLPGSWDWDLLYTNLNVRDSPYISGKKMYQHWWDNKQSGQIQSPLDKAAKAKYAANMQFLFLYANRIEIDRNQTPQIVSLRWPAYDFKGIFDEYCERESKPNLVRKQQAANKQPKDLLSGSEKSKTVEDDFWNSATNKDTKINNDEEFWKTTQSSSNANLSNDDDFWNSTKVLPEQWVGRLEKAEFLYGQKKLKEAKDLYKQVEMLNPKITYVTNRIIKIDKLLAYKPKAAADYTAVQSDNSPYLYGFKNKEGVLVIDYQYCTANSFSENFAKVAKCSDNGSKVGFIIGDNSMAIQAIYDNALNFSEGMAAVCMKKKWGFIDQNGILAIPCIYDYVESFINGKAYTETIDETKIEKTANDCDGACYGAEMTLFSSKFIDLNNKQASATEKSFDGHILSPGFSFFLTSEPSYRTPEQQERAERRKEQEHQRKIKCEEESDEKYKILLNWANSKGYNKQYDHKKTNQ